MRTIHFLTNIAPLYRKNLWLKLLSENSLDVHFFYGDNKIGIQPIDFADEAFQMYSERLHPIKNFWINKKYLVWQSGLIRNSIKNKPDLIVMLGEFNVISNWILSIIYKVRGVPIVFYGHGFYGDEKGLKFFLRRTYYQLANAHMVYEKRAKELMIRCGFKSNLVHVFYNSLDYDFQLRLRKKVLSGDKSLRYPFFNNPNLPTLLFIGRLTRQKKLNYLIELVHKLKNDGFLTNLLIIGDGPEQTVLKETSRIKNLGSNIQFYGSCYDESQLGILIAHADLCISPGNVGLTAIHCFSYGTPIATHSNFENQNPEVEAITEGLTGFLFEENNLEDLYLKTRNWLENSSVKRNEIRKACYAVIDEKYNTNNQLTIFKEIVHQQVDSKKK